MQLKTLVIVLVLGVAPILSHPLYARRNDRDDEDGDYSGEDEDRKGQRQGDRERGHGGKGQKGSDNNYRRPSEVSKEGDQSKSPGVLQKILKIFSRDLDMGLDERYFDDDDEQYYARDYYDELEARDYYDQELDVRDFEEDLYGRDLDSEELDARGLEYDDYYDLD
ncbi:hypothetical protein AMATHDRAFT_51762 [Amanita thiersii Skay4041]|uniref:CCD97-like C-terminal domain-containing protein n=1 Tax=Amanita thiersii Skay4041 TaxID=703135 RepID=A0A2A9NC53_9AGAR|nr:hypothetical protein AMATHDRAFT_51762 [Amanita thiersii Skay4041]